MSIRSIITCASLSLLLHHIITLVNGFTAISTITSRPTNIPNYNNERIQYSTRTGMRTQTNGVRNPTTSTTTPHQIKQTTTTTTTTLFSTNVNEIIPLKQGSTVALVTPFTPDGQIDFPSLRKLLQFHVEFQTDGLCILGTTGEASLLSMDERKAILDVAVEEVKGKIPILVGTGAIDPNTVKEMTLQAIDCGCDASLVVTPPYIKPPQRGLIQHFLSMADLALPVVIYNVPGRTAVDITPETIGLIAKEHENIVGVKEATGDITRVGQIRSTTSDLKKPLLLYSGDDSTEKDFVLTGGNGCISVTANVAPLAMHNLMKASLEGNDAKASRINDQLVNVHEKIFCESNPIPAKWALKRMGMIEHAYCRPPLMEMEESYSEVVEAALREAGLV